MAQKDKLTLSAGKVGTLRVNVDGCNVSVPDSIQVMTASKKNKYVGNHQTDEVEKITLKVMDTRAIEIANQANFDIAGMPSIFAEIQEPETVSRLVDHLDKLVGQQLSTAGASIALRWISFGNSGNWGGLKLILGAKQLTTRKETK